MAASISRSASDEDRTRFSRLILVIIDELTQILRDLLHSEISPTQIYNKVKQMNYLQKLRPDQIVAINDAHFQGYRDFDTTLLYTLLRNVCRNIQPPSRNWGVSKMPSKNEVTVGDDIERVRIIRNKICGHISEAAIPEREFKEYWSIIFDICTRMQALLKNDYVKRLQDAKECTIDAYTENKYIDLMKRLAEDEKTTRDIIQELTSKETIKIEPRIAEKGKTVEILTDTSILILNEMVGAVHELTSESDINQIYESIAEFIQDNKEEPENLKLHNLLKKLTEKITSYAKLQGPNRIKILANFNKFSLRMKREYGARVECSRSSILLLVTFSTLKGFNLYKNDLENGRIGEQILELFLYPHFLASFGLKANELVISLNGNLLTQHTDQNYIPYIPQDVARCDLCKIAIARSYCDFCHVNLCKPCKGEHISVDYRKHIIVPIHQRKSTLIYPKCETHPNKTCKYQCKDCNISICSDCLLLKQHNKEHKFINLREVFDTKKTHIKSDTEEIEQQFLPIYEDMANDLEMQIASLDGEYTKLTTEMSKQRREIHREVDNVINQMKKEIDEIKVKHHSILRKHLDEVKLLQSLMQQNLFALNELKESNEVSPTINYSSKNEEFRKLPSKVHVSMPKFIPKQTERKELCRLIGKLTPLSTKLEERVFTAKKPNASVRELLVKPEIINTINTGHKVLCSVTCRNEEHIWTSGLTADIKCFNIQGVLQKTIKTKSGEIPWGITVDRDEALFYSDTITMTVFKVKNDQTEEIITIQGWNPINLCVTSSGDLLVTMCSDDETQSKVIRYSGSTVKQTIQFDDKGQPLYSGNCYIKYISENRNFDICVADNRAGAVVVVNQTGKLRFRYTGHPSATRNMPFVPRGITTDSQSRILTADFENHYIHILDTDGQFLRYIDNCDLEHPWGLCVDSDDSLFVCEFYKGNLKKIRYSK